MIKLYFGSKRQKGLIIRTYVMQGHVMYHVNHFIDDISRINQIGAVLINFEKVKFSASGNN